MEVEEDQIEAQKAALIPSRPVHILSMQAVNNIMGSHVSPGISKTNNASSLITQQLKNMEAHELQGEKYKQLLEARELEDCLYSS